MKHFIPLIMLICLCTTSYAYDDYSDGTSGDVEAVGDCATGDCLDGTSDGGTYIKFYDAQGATTLSGGDTAGAITLTLPILTGTLITSGELDSLAKLETVSGGGAYMSDILAATDEANFKSITNLEAGTDFYSVAGADGAFQPLDATLTAVAAVTLVPATVLQDNVNANADPYTLTPTTGYEFVSIRIDTAVGDNCVINISKIGATNMQKIRIFNEQAQTLTFSDDAGNQEIPGYIELEQDNFVDFEYRTDRWVYTGSGTDVSYFSTVSVAGGALTYAYEIITPQSITYDDDDDLDQTIVTHLTSSIILVTGDNDTDGDSIDLQDGSVAGQLLTFIGVALIDADDTFIIDAETDSTCTGCPDAGIFTFDDPGDRVTLYWSGAAWFYQGSYAVD